MFVYLFFSSLPSACQPCSNYALTLFSSPRLIIASLVRKYPNDYCFDSFVGALGGIIFFSFPLRAPPAFTVSLTWLYWSGNGKNKLCNRCNIVDLAWYLLQFESQLKLLKTIQTWIIYDIIETMHFSHFLIFFSLFLSRKLNISTWQ